MYSNLVRQLSTLTSSPPSGKGITTVLKDHLRDGKKFVVPRTKRKGNRVGKITAKKGRAIGNRVDHDFRNIIAGKLRLRECDPRHNRLRLLFKALDKRGIRCVRGQFQVSCPDLGIWTKLDAIGIKGNSVVVIELKTTQFTREEHVDRYDRTCINRRKLTNGEPNNERTAHALQTAFGMLALSRKLPSSISIVGLVIVCTNDSAHLYDVDTKYLDTRYFKYHTTERKIGNYLKLVRFQPLPTTDHAVNMILTSLKPHIGKAVTFRNILTSYGNKYGSFTLSLGKAHYAIIVLVSSQTTIMSQRRQQQVHDDAMKLWIDRKKKATISTFLVYFYQGSNPIHAIEKLPIAYRPCA